MQNLLVKNFLNRDSFEKKYQSFTMPSETVPDQSLTIRQILDRYARGIPLESKTPIWDENADLDDVLPDPRTLDLSERAEFAEMAKNQIKEITEKVNTRPKFKHEKVAEIALESQIINPPAPLEN